jgi:hypothetical protein
MIYWVLNLIGYAVVIAACVGAHRGCPASWRLLLVALGNLVMGTGDLLRQSPLVGAVVAQYVLCAVALSLAWRFRRTAGRSAGTAEE